MGSRRFYTSLTFLVASVLAGCAGTAPGASVSSTPAVSPPPASASESPTTSAEPSPSESANQLSVTALDFSFELPASAPGGPTTITLANKGQDEHQAQTALIAEGKTIEDVIAALQGPDETAAFALLTFTGGPTGVVPGAEATVAVDLAPGNYAFLCFIAGADGVPHIAKGMVAPLEVTEPATAGELPEGDAEVAAKDFSFEPPDRLSAGTQTVTLTNDGPQPHEAALVRLNEGTTVEDIQAIIASGEPPSGPPPWVSAGGSTAIMPGDQTTMTLELQAGEYAFVCFVPDPASGKPHIDLGMIAPLTVR
jgi:uncharacterized cupredoxin-like copper-binding protein